MKIILQGRRRGPGPRYPYASRPFFHSQVGASRSGILRPDLVARAGAAPGARRELLSTYGAEAVTAAALECSSVLAQALANRWGVVPSNVLEDF